MGNSNKQKSFPSIQKGSYNIEIPKSMSSFWTVSLSSLKGFFILSFHLVIAVLISSDDNGEEVADDSYIS